MDAGTALLVMLIVGVVGAIVVNYLLYRFIRAGRSVGKVVRYATMASAVFVVMAIVPAFLLLLGVFGMLGVAGVIILVAVFGLQYLLPPFIYASRLWRIDEYNPQLGWLTSLAKGVAERAGYRKRFEVYLDPQPIPNAYAIGNELKRIVVVTQGLLDLGLSKEELEAVIAHEIGHLAHRDNAYAVSTSLTSFLTYIIGVAAVIFGLSVFSAASQSARAVNYSWNTRQQSSEGLAVLMTALIGASAVIFGLVMIALSVIVNIPVLAFSRIREHLADIYSVDTLRSDALASALTKIESGVEKMVAERRGGSIVPALRKKRGSKVVPELRKMLYIVPALSGAAVNIFSTHPPTEMRILVIQARLRETAAGT